ncbi:MAG: metallophosphoesterase [Myxococcota bacterium]
MKLAVVGDVHALFDREDVRLFNGGGPEGDPLYDAIIFVGDLTGYRDDGTDTARRIAELTSPCFVIPGNHDGAHLIHLAAETFGWAPVARLFADSHRRRTSRLAAALSPVPLVGFSHHDLDDFTLIAARPFSHGGPTVSFASDMRRMFGVSNMAESETRLRALVDAAVHDTLVFVGHNGPAGLGAERDSIFGRDFHRDAGDWGDRDLRGAIEYARERGKSVLAVLAGHMHHGLRGGGVRRWSEREGDTLFINAARVPRIEEVNGRSIRHHTCVHLDLDRGLAEAAAVQW